MTDWLRQRSLIKRLKTGCRNTKLWQEMELSAHVCKSSVACAHGEDDTMQTKMTECSIYCTLDVLGWY